MKISFLRMLQGGAIGAFLTFSVSSFAAPLVWMMDGSAMNFTDTINLKGVATPAKFPMQDDYEGAFDHNVPIGEQILVGTPNQNASVEAEWVISPRDAEVFAGTVDEQTPVILQGMLDGKYFGEFAKDQKHWLKASIGNNVIAYGRGIETTLGEIMRGEIGASIEAKYRDENGSEQVFTSRSDSLVGMPLIALVERIVSSAQGEGVTYINLGATDVNSAFVNNDKMKKSAIFKTLLSGHVLGVEQIKRSSLYYLSRDIIKHKKYIQEGVVTFSVLDKDNNSVGDGHINFVRP